MLESFLSQKWLCSKIVADQKCPLGTITNHSDKIKKNFPKIFGNFGVATNLQIENFNGSDQVGTFNLSHMATLRSLAAKSHYVITIIL